MSIIFLFSYASLCTNSRLAVVLAVNLLPPVATTDYLIWQRLIYLACSCTMYSYGLECGTRCD
jgi:hypothetical protein